MRKYIFLTVLAFAIGTFDAFSQSQNMRFKEVIREYASYQNSNSLTYTVPQGHVFKMTSYSVSSQSYSGVMKINGVTMATKIDGPYPAHSINCEIWFKEGDVIELIPHGTYANDRHFSGILYELY